MDITTLAIAKKFAKEYTDTHASKLTEEDAVRAVANYFNENPNAIVTNDELEIILNQYLRQEELPDLKPQINQLKRDIATKITAPATASVGQTIVVKAVDETGKPTKWEPVKLTEADKWEFINEVTIADDAGEASEFFFSIGKDGNPFSLQKALFLMYYPQYTGESTIPNFGFACINGIALGEEAPLIYTGIALPTSSYPFSSAWGVGLDYSDNLWKESIFSSDSCYISGVEKNGFLWGYDTKGVAHRNNYRLNISEFKRTKTYPITSIGLKKGLIFPGCKFWLYGVRT